jgi:hypothetical protein
MMVATQDHLIPDEHRTMSKIWTFIGALSMENCATIQLNAAIIASYDMLVFGRTVWYWLPDFETYLCTHDNGPAFDMNGLGSLASFVKNKDNAEQIADPVFRRWLQAARRGRWNMPVLDRLREGWRKRVEVVSLILSKRCLSSDSPLRLFLPTEGRA